MDDYKITIGKGVLFAPNVTISTTGHPVHYKLRPHGEMYSFPVTIGDDVWIGSGVIIMPGVTIGDHSVIGAGSIVTRYSRRLHCCGKPMQSAAGDHG
ncbi:MAG: DapH/DapD/GlmU-related protein [Blautia marasmi]